MRLSPPFAIRVPKMVFPSITPHPMGQVRMATMSCAFAAVAPPRVAAAASAARAELRMVRVSFMVSSSCVVDASVA